MLQPSSTSSVVLCSWLFLLPSLMPRVRHSDQLRCTHSALTTLSGTQTWPTCSRTQTSSTCGHLSYSASWSPFLSRVRSLPATALGVYVIPTVLVAAGFVPTVGILITPFSCDTMKMHNGAEFECWSAHRVVFLVLSLGTLLLYLPFGLASSLVFHEYVLAAG